MLRSVNVLGILLHLLWIGLHSLPGILHLDGLVTFSQIRAIRCEIAWAAIRTTSQFKSRYQGLVIRRGTQKAIIAIAHKVLKTVFVLLSRHVPYQDSTVDDEALSVQRHAPRWIRPLKKYGYLPKAA